MGETAVETEVVVIGGGPGGYAAAFRAAQQGLGTTLISDESQGLGGVCLLRGCIPSKALLEMTGRIDLAREAGEAGIGFSEPDVDTGKLRDWCSGVVEALTSGLESLAEEKGVRIIQGRARFESSSRLRVDDSEVTAVEFGHAVVATGARPVELPDLPFGGPVWDSERALALEEIPERLLVVGAGYVGLELGTVYARLGSSVTVVEMEDRILPMVDPDLVKPLAERLGERFEEIRLETRVEGAEVKDDEVTVKLSGGEETFDRVLVAVGREPVTEDLGLEETGVERDEDGFLLVDETRRTGDERIFAVGDCTGGWGLAHEAMAEGKVAADILAGKPAAWDVRAVPAVVYTDPQIAWCGLMEDEARADDGEVEVGRFPFTSSGRARTMGVSATEGLVKLVADGNTGRLLGMGVTGRHVEALVAEAALALEMGATAMDLALTIHPHPTLSEALMEAAEILLGLPTHHTTSGGAGSGSAAKRGDGEDEGDGGDGDPEADAESGDGDKDADGEEEER